MTHQAKECCEWNAAIEVAASLMENSGFTYVGTCESGLVASRGGQAATRICAATIRSLKRAPSHQAGQEGEKLEFQHAGTAESFFKLNTGPMRLTIGNLVSIDLKDGSIKYNEGYTPDAAAKQFWDAMAHYHPNATRIETLKEALREIERLAGRSGPPKEIDACHEITRVARNALADGGG